MQTDEGPAPAAKRRRVTKACDQCSKRRRKCEGGTPSCAGCIAQGKPETCTYSKPIKRRGPTAGYSAVARSATERVRLLSLLLGDLILLSPHVADLLDFVVERRTSCSLVPSSPPPPRSDEARLTAWSQSAASAWVDERMDELAPEDAVVAPEPSVEPDREPTPLASTSAVPLDPVPVQPLYRLSPLPLTAFNPYSRPPAPSPPTHHSPAFDLSSRFPPVASHVKAEEPTWTGFSEGSHSMFGEGAPLEPGGRTDGLFDFGQWNDPDEVLKFLGVNGPTRPSSPSNAHHHHDGFDIDLVGRWEARGVVVGGEWGWAQEMH